MTAISTVAGRSGSKYVKGYTLRVLKISVILHRF